MGIGLLAEDIISILYTDEFMNSVLPLQILIGSLIFSYISFPIGAFLNACNKQVTQTVIVATVMVTNIAANVLLIPTYGVVGAASAAFMGNVLLTVLGYMIVPKITNISHSFLLKTLLQVCVAAGVMGMIVWKVNSEAHFVFAIIAGALAYPAMLFATQAVNRRQIREALSLVRK